MIKIFGDGVNQIENIIETAFDAGVSETDSPNVKELKEYFNEIFRNTRQLADTDLEYVEEALITLREEKER